MRHCLLATLTLAFALPACADIYTYHNPDGRFYFTDKRMGASYKLIRVYRPQLTKQSTKGYTAKQYRINLRKYMPHIRHAAALYRLDSKLIQAIIDTESAFNPKARSKTGAMGLMQLMPKTAQALKVQNVWDPRQNILAGSRYFKQLLDTFNQDVRLSLAAYNAGPTAVQQAGNAIPDYPETRRYVDKVLATYRKLSAKP